MDRAQKAAFIADLNADVVKAGNGTMVVAHYRGLTVKQLQALRRSMGAGGKAQVSKNRLAKLALKGTPFEVANELLVGPTLLAFSDDVIAAAKATHTFAKDNEALVIIGGVMDGKLIDKSAVQSLAMLPSLNELRGKLVGLLQAPAGQIARVLKAHAEKGGVVAAPAAEAAPEAPAAAAVEAPAAETAAAPAEQPTA